VRKNCDFDPGECRRSGRLNVTGINIGLNFRCHPDRVHIHFSTIPIGTIEHSGCSGEFRLAEAIFLVRHSLRQDDHNP